MKRTQLPLIVITIFMFFLTGCGFVTSTPLPPISDKTNDELIQLLDTFKYDSDEVSEYAFYMIVEELEKRGASASEAAPTLARMIAFNGSTSVTASHPLVAMGSSAQSAIPFLLQNLESEREDVRRYSIFVLGTIGESASCAVPLIAPFLWDTDPFVRSATAGALTEITQIMLVEDDLYRLDPTSPGSVAADGNYTISKIAREWWLESGQYLEWPGNNCTLP
jgi:hypothetical protein